MDDSLPDYTNLVIRWQADEEQALLERVVSLEDDVSIYRELVQEALAALHRDQAIIARLQDENRRLRACLLKHQSAA